MLLLQDVVHRNGVFVFCPFFFLIILFLAVCIPDIFGCLVGAEVGCNWYLHNINIFSLSKKIYCSMQSTVNTYIISQTFETYKHEV